MPDGLQAVQPRHGDVRHRDVRLEFGNGGHQGTAVANAPDQLKTLLEQGLQSLRYDRMIVRE